MTSTTWRCALPLLFFLPACTAPANPGFRLFQSEGCLRYDYSSEDVACSVTGPSDLSRGYSMLPDEPLDRATWDRLFFFAGPGIPRAPYAPPRSF